MKLNSKVTGGLAWAGLVLILAVPSAEMLSKPSAWHVDTGGDSTTPAAKTAVTETAALVAPKPATRSTPRTVPAAGTDPVESYVASGKKLPAYISDALDAEAAEAVASTPAAPATTRKIVVPTAPQTAEVGSDGTFVGETDAITTASVEPAVGAPPMPYPVTRRPTGRSVATVGDGPLIVDEDAVVRREVASQSGEPFLREPAHLVDSEELEEWNSGSLADYLERRGLLGEGEPAARDLEREFDEDGFFLSDGPSRDRDDGPRLIGRYEGGWLLF